LKKKKKLVTTEDDSRAKRHATGNNPFAWIIENARTSTAKNLGIYTSANFEVLLKDKRSRPLTIESLAIEPLNAVPITSAPLEIVVVDAFDSNQEELMDVKSILEAVV
jgi:hypothetical protein